MWTYNYTNELQHWGIKGQKWGVRRFQNANGSLTPAGRKRYSETSAGGHKRIESEDHKQAHALKSKKLYEMSNKELETLTRRMQLEQNYRNLNKQKVSKGQQIVSSVLTEIGKETFKSFAKNIINKKVPDLVKAASEMKKESGVL